MLVRPSIPKPIVVAATVGLLLVSVVASGQQGPTNIEVTRAMRPPAPGYHMAHDPCPILVVTDGFAPT